MSYHLEPIPPALASGSPPDSDLSACLAAFQAERDFVLRTLRRHRVDPSELEDLAQEVFLVLWQRWPTFDPRRPLRPWLVGIIFRLAAHHFRRTLREVPVVAPVEAAAASDLEEEMNARQARSLVREAVASMPPRHRTVFELFDLEGRPMQEIARRLSAPLATVYTRLRVGRRSFRKAVRQLQLRSDLGRR
jgi:RNA polymerase sigma-70 factor (ECF subfamily)